MKHYSLYIISALAAMMLLASCRSSKHAAEGNDVPPTTTVVTQPEVTQPGVAQGTTDTPSAVPAEKNFTARVKVKVKMGEQDISTSGMLRMRWDDVIQLTLVDPIIGIKEVGRMELSPEGMLVIDRLHQRYVQVAYGDIPQMRDRGIDFAAIQARFWDEARNSNEISLPIPMSKPMQLDLRLSDKGHASNWEGHTTLSSKYVKVDAERLLQSMMQLVE